MIVNNVIYENTANGTIGNGGGLCSSSASNNYFVNNTYADNHAPNGTGGGAYVNMGSGTIAVFSNEIFWGNTAGSTSGKQLNYGGSPIPTVTYSNVPWSGQGNIWLDPEFVTERDNYHLDTDSLCKDAGDKTAYGVPSEDIDGDPRIQNGQVEMGMDEINEQ